MATTPEVDWAFNSLAERLSNASTHQYVFKQIRIGVAGFKGGCGTSYLTAALTVAALTAGYRVAHVVTHRECNNAFSGYLDNHNLYESNLRMYNSIEESLEDTKLSPEFSIFDIPNQAFFGYGHYAGIEESISSLIDVFIHPTQFDAPFDHTRLLRSIDSENPLPRHRRIIVPISSSINLPHFNSAFSKLDDYFNLFSDVFYFERDPFNFNPITPLSPVSFSDELSQHRYQKLLAESVRVAICESMNERLHSLNPYFDELVFQR